ARGLRFFVLHDALREVDELRRELVALLEGLVARLALDRDRLLELLGVVVRRIEAHLAARADDSIGRDVARAEAAREGRQALIGEAQDGARHLFAGSKARLAVVGAEGRDLDRLALEERA